MPEKMTKEEVRVAQAIEQVRIVKELVQQASAERIAYDDKSEEVKVKRPKKTGEKDKTKIENNKGTHSGYGLAGQESHFKKEDLNEVDYDTILREKFQGIKGLDVETAITWLYDTGSKRITKENLKKVEREFAGMTEESKREIYTRFALSKALGQPLFPPKFIAPPTYELSP